MLSTQECLDLRRKVLKGEQLSLDEARQVFETLRQGQVAAMTAPPGEKKRVSKKKPSTTDEELNASLAKFGI
jgi:hypothetical protein